MRLILKHLFRTVRQRPTQPIILTLTLALSVVVSMFALTTDSMIMSEIIIATREEYGESDFTVSLNADSNSRFMFSSQVRDILGDRADAVGAFELAAFVGDDSRAVFAVATELDKISSIFDFRFTEISPISPSSVGECVFVSSDFARENSLSLGDSVEIEIGRVKRSYIVCGISDAKFMASFDLMLDVVGVMRILTSSSPILAPMADSFKPGGTIYVDASSGLENECIDLLLSDDSFSDKVITRVEEQVSGNNTVNFINIPMRVAVLLALLLSAAITYTCFYILSTERVEENIVLSYAGANGRMLSGLQYLEALVYWLIGGGLGLALSLPILGSIADFSGFRYAEAVTSGKNIFISELGILVSSLVAVAVFTHMPKEHIGKKINRLSGVIAVTLGLGFIISYIAVFLMPPSYTFAPFVVGACFLLLLILTIVPGILKWLCHLIDSRIGKTPRSAFKYAVKNLFKVSILHNTGRLVAAVSIIVITMLFVIGSYFGTIESSAAMISGDYAVLGANARCYELISSSENVESLYGIYYSREKIGYSYTSVISADTVDSLSPDLGVTELPVGNGAIISRGHSKMLSLDVGDSLSVEISGRKVELRIVEIAKSPTQFLLVDADGLGIAPNMIVVNGADGVSDSELFEELSFVTSLEMVAVTPLFDLLNEWVEPLRVFLRAALLLLAISVIFASIGILDNLGESYRARKGEFELYRMAGMSPVEITKMKMYEILATFGVGILIGVLLFVVEMFAVHTAISHFGYDVFASIGYLLK
ncbi:MAG: hypothetical protein J6V80_06620 [Clostridia bacterium]|nr:hypothetical protein [Clostridia bacterium]